MTIAIFAINNEELSNWKVLRTTIGQNTGRQVILVTCPSSTPVTQTEFNTHFFKESICRNAKIIAKPYATLEQFDKICKSEKFFTWEQLDKIHKESKNTYRYVIDWIVMGSGISYLNLQGYQISRYDDEGVGFVHTGIDMRD